MYDEDNFRFVTKDGSIELSFDEGNILSLLFKNKGHITTYNEIGELYQVKNYNIIDNRIRVIICRLRKKLKGQLEINAHRERGYRLK